MEQRRVVAFLAISVLVLLLFGPKQKPSEQADAKKAPAQAEERAEAAADKPPAENQPKAPVAKPAVDEPVEEVDPEYVTLGSVAKDSRYRVLVTLTNQGAGVRRVELASPRYRDLHDLRGYLGHLETVADPAGGLRVQAVGIGTPAAEAGLKVGDRILAAKGEAEFSKLAAPAELAKLLSQKRPGQQLVLQVASGGAEPDDRTVVLGRRPLEIMRPESENVGMRTDKLPAGVTEPPSFLFTLEQLGSEKIKRLAEEELPLLGVKSWDVRAEPELAGVALRDSNWEIEARDETSVSFRKRLPEHSIEVIKRYRLEEVPADQLSNQDYPGYGLSLDIEIRNYGEQESSLVYRLDGPNGLPTEGWWYANKISRNWSAGGLRDVVARYEGGNTVQVGPIDIIKGSVEPMQGRPLAFIGVDAQYFSAVMMPSKDSLSDQWIDEARMVSLSEKPNSKEVGTQGRFVNVTCRLVSQPLRIEAGSTLSHSYQIFTGPKRPDLLANYFASGSSRYSLDDLLYYGWFGGVAKLMLSILHFFYRFVGNYGIAIIMLTVLVRSCMFPISRKQAQSMAKMQELKPEMDKLKEKYKNDMQKQSQAMQEIYKKHNINPLAGCLPMFIQLPIFLGLYRALMVDVELRQAPLLGGAIRWCSNLAAPDMFFDWSGFMPEFITSGIGILGLGPYLNVLPLITVSLFLLQQKLFMPEPANEQAALQQKIMKFMMLFMGLLFFKVASGLCLYFIASSIWGIAERKLIPKPAPAGLAETEAKSSVAVRESSNGLARGSRPKKKPKKKR
ncbi:MAG: YidC/Oxa1 family insertase periplasmic-domain containing protein [Planctomycetales bacterium]|nr:YidC/Oxa1 family insertase periplasmic-domain containing protein [Planctomycetales bacterium]